MEPLTALALSGNILQFIDGTGKLIKEARQICKSVNGFTTANRDAIAVYDDFRTAAAGLAARPPPSSTLSGDDAAVVSLAERCQELSDELVQGLQQLQAKNPGSKREAIRVALRTLRDKGELESLETRLDRYRQQLVDRIIFMMSQGQSSTYRLLQECKVQGEDSATKTRDDLRELSQELLQIAQTVKQCNQDAVSDTVQQITDLISNITATRRKAEMEDRILDKLRFPGMRRRENAIEPARAGTYRWLLHPLSTVQHADEDTSITQLLQDQEEDIMQAILSLRKFAIQHAQSLLESKTETRLKEETRSRFLAWLESGSGIFYLSGKPGSGKSTMMKFISRENKTSEVLKTWAAEKKLVFASFFFWNSGLGLQRSIEGLYRSLLWETLRSCPELIPTAFPHLWDCDPYDTELLLSEIEEAFSRLINASSNLLNHRICFFIDGLDEFEGNHLKLANLLNEWTASSEIKICVSSRPYSEFENSFNTRPDQCLRLHELTYQDMVQTAQDELKDIKLRPSTPSDEQDHLQLIKAAVKKANGVFLWLRLAMRHLVRGIGNSYSAPQLSEMLHAMPEDVSVMFQTMLDRLLARPDRVRVAITFLCLSEPGLPTNCRHYVAYFSAMDDVLDSAIGLDDLLGSSLHKRYSPDKIEQRLATTEARLKGRCEDFIETHDSIGKDTPPVMRRYIGFVHRDVRDFLTQEHIMEKLYKIAGCLPSKIAGLHRYLGLVLLRTVPEITSWHSWLDDLVDEFFDSETVTAAELELLLCLIATDRLKAYRASRRGAKRGGKEHGWGRSQRYCTVLAVRDNILYNHIEKKVYYGKSEPAPPLSVALEFITAAAFHRHDEYVLGLVTRFPILLDLDFNVNILLSASLGGGAAHISFMSQDKEEAMLACVPRRGNFLKSIIGSDYAVNGGGLGGLLYPNTAQELFNGPEPVPDQAFDAHAYGDPEPARQKLRRGPRAATDPFFLARALLEKGAGPNAKLTYFEVPAWPGSHWTPWTTTLLGLAGVIRRGEMHSEALLDIIQIYLSHGADPTICFVGRYLPKHGLKPVPVWRVGPGIYASIKIEAHVKTLWGDKDSGSESDDDGNDVKKIENKNRSSSKNKKKNNKNDSNNDDKDNNKNDKKENNNDKNSNRWFYLTLSQLIDLLDDSPRSPGKKKGVTDLLYSKSPWAVSKWVGQAAASIGSLGGLVKRQQSPEKGAQSESSPTKITKLELSDLGDCYFFVSMIVREQELGGVSMPKGARERMLPASLIPI